MEAETFSQFKPTLDDIEPDEIIKYLLVETGQESAAHLDIDKILTYLNLKLIEMEFSTEFEGLILPEKMPRALISFSDKIIAIQSDLNDRRRRFSILHEIGHYVLPDHRHDLFICSNDDFSPDADKKWELEANAFASEMLFLAGKIEKDVHSYKHLSAKLVKKFGDQYLASYESTARRLASKSLKPYMLLAFKEAPDKDSWLLKYVIPSKAFKTDYFSDIAVKLGNEIASEIKQLEDVSESIEKKLTTDSMKGKVEFNIEFFSNFYNIFAFISPVSE